MRCAMAWADWRTLDLVSSLRLTTRTTPLILCWIKWTRWISRSTTQTNRLKTSNKTNTYLAHFTETKDGNRPSCHFALHPGLCRTMSDFLFFFYGLEHITLADMQVKTFFIRIIFFLNDWEVIYVSDLPINPSLCQNSFCHFIDLCAKDSISCVY